MRICSGAGCLRAVDDAVRYCDDCKPAGAPKQPDDIRNHTSGYDPELDRLVQGTRWKSIRRSVLARDPICKRCDTSLSIEVDHVVPAREAIEQARLSGKYPFDRQAGYFLTSNLQGLCRKCHRAKTNEDKLHTGEWPDVVAKDAAAPKRRFTF